MTFIFFSRIRLTLAIFAETDFRLAFTVTVNVTVALTENHEGVSFDNATSIIANAACFHNSITFFNLLTIPGELTLWA